MRGGLVVAAAVAALAFSTMPVGAAAPLKVGQTRTFSMDDIDMIGSVNSMLNKQVGGEQMASGGTYKRLTADLSLICGYYIDTHQGVNDTAPPSGYAILVDKGNKSFTTFAPITPAQQEAKGCWPGQRQRMEREIKQLDRLLKGSGH